MKQSGTLLTLRRNVRGELARLRKCEKIDLREDVEPLLELREAIRTYLQQLGQRFRTTAEEHPVCSRFLEIPGVRPICALSFYSAIEDPVRFRRNRDVGAFLGMVPKIRQSGPTTIRLRISKMGNRMTRMQLFCRCHLTPPLGEDRPNNLGGSVGRKNRQATGEDGGGSPACDHNELHVEVGSFL